MFVHVYVLLDNNLQINRSQTAMQFWKNQNKRMDTWEIFTKRMQSTIFGTTEWNNWMQEEKKKWRHQKEFVRKWFAESCRDINITS